MPVFLSFGTFEAGRTKQVIEAAKSAPVPPQIKVTGMYITFGKYDGACLFEAPDEKAAMEFVEGLRSIPGVVSTETMLLTPIR